VLGLGSVFCLGLGTAGNRDAEMEYQILVADTLWFRNVWYEVNRNHIASNMTN